MGLFKKKSLVIAPEEITVAAINFAEKRLGIKHNPRVSYTCDPPERNVVRKYPQDYPVGYDLSKTNTSPTSKTINRGH